MREAFWNGLFDVRWEEAPLGPEAIRLIQRLRERGYAERTCRDYGHAVVHLGRYLHEELESDRVRDEGVVADFLAGHLPGCRCYRRPAGRREEPARRGLAHLLVMLREEGAFPPVTADEPPYRQLIEGYCRFLRHERGLAETTVANYRRYLRDFLVSRGAAVSPVELAALGAEDLLAFSRQRGAGLGRTAWNHLATALSGFYGVQGCEVAEMSSFPCLMRVMSSSGRSGIGWAIGWWTGIWTSWRAGAGRTRCGRWPLT